MPAKPSEKPVTIEDLRESRTALAAWRCTVNTRTVKRKAAAVVDRVDRVRRHSATTLKARR